MPHPAKADRAPKQHNARSAQPNVDRMCTRKVRLAVAAMDGRLSYKFRRRKGISFRGPAARRQRMPVPRTIAMMPRPILSSRAGESVRCVTRMHSSSCAKSNRKGTDAAVCTKRTQIRAAGCRLESAGVTFVDHRGGGASGSEDGVQEAPMIADGKRAELLTLASAALDPLRTRRRDVRPHHQHWQGR
jgi:hypothetical protein